MKAKFPEVAVNQAIAWSRLSLDGSSTTMLRHMLRSIKDCRVEMGSIFVMYPGVTPVKRGFPVDHLLLNTSFGAITARGGLHLTIGTLKQRGRMDVPLLRI